jgi:hypothetical protein
MKTDRRPTPSGWRWVFKLQHWRPGRVLTFVTAFTKRSVSPYRG